MTLTADPEPTVATSPQVPPAPRPAPAAIAAPAPAPPADDERADPVRERLSGRRIAVLCGVWALVVVVCLVGVLYGLEPLFAQRDQQRLLADYRAEIQRAANESLTIGGATTPTKPPELGDAVGIVEIGGIQVQQVAVEGALPSQTATGVVHVPGTAGLGQAGNAVLVGRHSTFNAPFASLGEVHKGDEILVSTRQGQSVYVIDSVGEHVIDDGAPAAEQKDDLYATNAAPADPLSQEVVRSADLYGRAGDSRLTLLTSSTARPWNATAATVVVAKLRGKPYTATPQNGLTDTQTGRGSDPTAWAPMILALIFFEVVVVAALYLYRNSSRRVAYVLTAAPLLVAVILATETLTRLVPAWY